MKERVNQRVSPGFRLVKGKRLSAAALTSACAWGLRVVSWDKGGSERAGPASGPSKKLEASGQKVCLSAGFVHGSPPELASISPEATKLPRAQCF